ncbi:type II secretion system protein C (GspC) [Lentibacillus persicus]|uniref:ComG operon protein 3 n=1 Tax=Lentibacillus persicus TaxID=640948 RepID=A0A1I1T9I1_9BACI|nr:competence type IV pilus major pilin ComGC [Lentibacillus persicus]SFD53768.1 type II secretion system protein C (GspC) [Lentibacillus persicus]
MFNNQRGFTLIEMLIVLMIISVLIILIVPNLGDKSEEVYDKGCSALVSVVQAQADAYYIEEKARPSLKDLLDNDYITEDQQTCPDGTGLSIDIDSGEVSVTE